MDRICSQLTRDRRYFTLFAGNRRNLRNGKKYSIINKFENILSLNYFFFGPHRVYILRCRQLTFPLRLYIFRDRLENTRLLRGVSGWRGRGNAGIREFNDFTIKWLNGWRGSVVPPYSLHIPTADCIFFLIAGVQPKFFGVRIRPENPVVMVGTHVDALFRLARKALEAGRERLRFEQLWKRSV